jgi:polygalacturonase
VKIKLKTMTIKINKSTLTFFKIIFFFIVLPFSALLFQSLNTQAENLVVKHSVVSKNSSFLITDYGAIGDGETICTASIQLAIDACTKAGGGKVVFPPGKYLSGTIVLKSNVELHFEQNAILLGSTHHKDYPLQPLSKYRSHKDQLGGFYALIYADGTNNIAITGNGTIDGQGKLQKPRKNPKARDIDGRPRNLLLISCKNIRIDGIHFRNSGVWNQHYLNCEDVIISNITVYNHSNRNNDGIDIDGCRRVILANSIFDSDDDGITLKSTGATPCEDIAISNCVVSSFCNAIKAGTESTGGFKNISISNCVIKPSASKEEPVFNTPEIGIAGLALIIVDGGTMEGITVNNLTINGTMAPIYIRLGNRARPHTAGAPVPEVGKVHNISISNVVAYNAGSWGSSITGIPGFPVENISLNNIQLFTEGGVKKENFNVAVKENEKGYPQPTTWRNLPAYGLFIRHAKNISINNLMLGTTAPDIRVPIVANDVFGLQIKNCQLSGKNPERPFVSGKLVKQLDIERPLGWTGDELILLKE